VAREVYGAAARYVSDASDTQSVAAALRELLTSDEARARILLHAENVLSRYDWAVTAAATLGAIQEAAGA
jgi:glycosyltransferase involved in cell wall biosynthesis